MGLVPLFPFVSLLEIWHEITSQEPGQLLWREDLGWKLVGKRFAKGNKTVYNNDK